MLIEILLLPLLSAFTLGLFGRFLGRFGAMMLSTFNMWVAFVLSVITAYQVVTTHTFLHYNLGK